jgi:hypothetical protein
MNNGGTIDTSDWCLCEGTGENKHEGKRIIESVMKYWLRLLETDEANPLVDSLEQKRKNEETTG